MDINPGGSHLLVGDEGGKARLVTLRTSENKGGIEQTYSSPKFQGKRQDFPSVFATKGQAVLHGTLNGCALVWDKRKGTIVYGLKHPEGMDSHTRGLIVHDNDNVDGLFCIR